MPKIKKEITKAPAKPAGKKAVKNVVSRIKKVRALQENFAEVMQTKEATLKENPVFAPETPAAAKVVKTCGTVRKGLFNKVCFKAGVLFGDASALLRVGKTE